MVVDLECRQVSLSDSRKLWLWHGLWGGNGEDCYKRNFRSQLIIQSRRSSKCELGTVLSAFHMISDNTVWSIAAVLNALLVLQVLLEQLFLTEYFDGKESL